MSLRKVFHPGERALQETHGVADRMAEIGAQVIRPFMPEQHRDFFEGLSYLFVGARDDLGRPWATLAVGHAGFVQSPHPTRLSIAGKPVAADLLRLQMQAGEMIGLLGLDLTNRRRNRMNGVISGGDESGRLNIDVRHSFGNCPKYIQTREVRDFQSGAAAAFAGSATRFTKLAEPVREMLARSDCFFIASAHCAGEREAAAGGASSERLGVDVSHRGGPPGFVRVESEIRLVWDDYPGNLFYNTLGNLLLNPAAGLLFVDFDSGDLFFLSGRATIHDYTPAEIEAASRYMPRGKILRRVLFELREGYHLTGDASMRWPLREYSPALPGRA